MLNWEAMPSGKDPYFRLLAVGWISRRISFGDAALMWSSFYHLMFRSNPDSMKGKDIKSVLEKSCTAFGVPFVYYRSSRSARSGYKKHVY